MSIMEQKGFCFDMTACTGCKCCQVACKDKNDLEVGFFFRKATDYEGGKFPDVWSATLSMGCNHCENPACVANCPQGALMKEEEFGFVIQDLEACIGCQTCVNACPYGAPVYFPDEQKVRKCDGCIDWVKNGLQPACAGACSTRALQFDSLTTLRSTFDGAGLTSDLSVLPSSEETRPSYVIIPKPELV